MMQQPSTSSTPSSSFSTRAQVLGWIQIVCGIVIFILSCINIYYEFGFYFIGYGIWGSVVFIVAGALTVQSAADNTKRMIIASMVTCIVSAVLAAFIFSIGFIGTIWSNVENEWYTRDKLGNRYLDTKYRIVIHAIVAVLALTEMIVAIVTSGFDCKAIKCCDCCQTQEQTIAPVQYAAVEGGGLVPIVISDQKSSGKLNAEFASGNPPQHTDVHEKQGFQ